MLIFAVICSTSSAANQTRKRLPQPPHFFHCARQRHIQGSCQEWKNIEALTAKSAISLQEKLADHHRSLEEGSLKQYH